MSNATSLPGYSSPFERICDDCEGRGRYIPQFSMSGEDVFCKFCDGEGIHLLPCESEVDEFEAYKSVRDAE